MTPIVFALVLVTCLASPCRALAQSVEDLQDDAKTTADVLVYGMGYGQNRYSPLDQVNRDTVKGLVPVWSYSLNDDRGQESHPLVRDGVVYVSTHKATIAVDARSGKQLWKTTVDYPPETPRVACCGIVNRGLAMFDGKIFRTTLDANVIALDAKTGKEFWRTNSNDISLGYSMTVAPLVVNGVVIVGISGGEYGTRGYIEGYAAGTGKRLWRTYTVPAPGEPGSDSWKDATNAWEKGGGAAWITGTYDAELDTVYWGVGNPGPWNASVRPGDNLYTCSVLALDPKSGEIKWHYQFTPNDSFDYDGVNELVLGEIAGRKVVMQANRNGFLYVLDRATGSLVAANKFIERVDWASSVDLSTGRPKETELARRIRAGEQVTFWPSAFGGKNWSPMAFDPKAGMVFANVLNIGMNFKAVQPKYRKGVFYLGADFTLDWPEGDRGSLRAIDPLTGKAKWSQPTAIPRFAGVLATAGGLLFTGQQTGEFEAFDSATGKKLWQFQTGSGIVGQPITWEMDGHQYISILSGSGGIYPLFSGDERLANTPAGGSLWTFALYK